ncbi:MAG: hypothetical protein IT440_11735, partial [Phycisphaeraceae bacterium]|nr:hypothetical protein [Phycisphaeraceae bacterium]
MFGKCVQVLILTTQLVLNQTPASPEAPATTPAGQVMINLPDDVELKVLVSYVSQRLGVNFLYDESIANQRITIKSPTQIPTEALIGLLESVLMMKGLVLVDAPTPGFKAIVQSKDLIGVASSPADATVKTDSTSAAVTQVFGIQYADIRQMEPILKAYLSKPGGNLVVAPEQRLLIVTDMAIIVKRIADLVMVLDTPQPKRTFDSIVVHFADVKDLGQKVKQATQLQGKSTARAPDVTSIDIIADERTSQLLVVGLQQQIEDAKRLATLLDVPIS